MSRAGSKTESPPARGTCGLELRAFRWALPLLAAINHQLAEKPRVLVALEGGSASGKTTLAALLERVYGASVCHMDDFFLRPEQRTPERFAQPGGNVDRERFREEVLEPLRRGEDVRYRRFDCGSFTLEPSTLIRPGRVNIVEGAYAMHPELAPYYDCTVFLRVPPEEQRRRILRRNGDRAEMFFRRWIPLEERYFREMNVEQRCDFVFPGK